MKKLLKIGFFCILFLLCNCQVLAQYNGSVVKTKIRCFYNELIR